MRTAFAALCATLAAGAGLAAGLTKVDIAPPLFANTTGPGSYTLGAGDAFTVSGWGNGFYPNMDFGTAGALRDINETGDVLTFAYEEVTGDFDRRVKITSIVSDPADPIDPWTRGALMVRTGTNHYNASLHLVAANPAISPEAPTGANQVRFCGRALDGQNYGEFGRSYGGVDKVLPNQWLRLRRVGDYFAAYVGKNGTDWTLIGERYQEWPAKVFVGVYAGAGTVDTKATVQFASYGPTPLNDSIAPRLVSAGTIDKKMVGVRFSEPVDSSTATVKANYGLSQGTISDVKMGIGGDSVYLTVTGLTADNFSVTVVGGVKDTAGNLIAANSVVQARALNWNAVDIGAIQNPNNRPTVGDDPYRVGRSVMVSSDENPEIEVVGGGSNQWNPGDFIHYIHRVEPLSGDFDVTVAVSRFDRSIPQGGYSNSGIMLRASPYLEGNNPDTGLPFAYTAEGTKVPMVANPTYIEASAPGRGAIPLWRTDPRGGYGNGNAGFSWATIIGGIKGYYSGLRGIDASGAIDPQSSPNSARYLRIKRTGTEYFFYASWDGVDWAQVDKANLPALPNNLLLGFSTMTDSGAFDTPFSAYGNNGHMIDPNDPLNPLNPAIDPPAPGGRSYMNEANYAVQRIKVFPNGVPVPVPVDLDVVDIKAADSTALPGSFASTGTYSFDITGGGTGVFRNLPAPQDGTSGGDELTFAYEEITGDFDKQIRVTEITSSFFDAFGTAYVPVEGDPPLPVDAWARGGLMARADTNSYSACFKIMAGNPAVEAGEPLTEGANRVQVRGRAIDGQVYSMFSRDYVGVRDALPNQWLRMQRVGNTFSFYVSKEGVNWVLIGRRFQEMPAKMYVGAYSGAALDPLAANNPLGLYARATVKFADYKDVDLGDVVPPALVSVGTFDKKTIGVKFSEAVSSATAGNEANYTLSQGTVTDAKTGAYSDSVYLTVTGLTSDTFTVTVNNVEDTAGNRIAAGSVAQGKTSPWVVDDVGFIQNPNNRPTVGDDPYRVGQSVALSSDDNVEVDVIGGGSNAWNSGDFVHFLHHKDKLTGDFDVAVQVSRYDSTANQGCCSHGGLMLRESLYLAGQEHTVEGTKVPFISNETYHQGSGTGSILLYRNEAGAGYAAPASVGWGTLIGGIKGYFTGMNATNTVGDPDPESSATSARWLRITREGDAFHLSASWDGVTWNNYGNTTAAELSLSGSLVVGVSVMTDSGASAPPFSAYGANGHTIDPNDPLNPAIAGGNVMNESNFVAQRVRIFPNGPVVGPPGPLAISQAGGQVTVTWPGTGTLESAPAVTGPWNPVAGAASPYSVPATAAATYYRLSR